jgi:hypothetical protein
MSRPQIDDLTWATDDDFTNGIDVGTPTKSTPTAGERAEGFIPDVGADAQVINKVLHDQGAILNYLKDIEWLNWERMVASESSSTMDKGPIGAMAFHEDVDTSSPGFRRFLFLCSGDNDAFQSRDGVNWSTLGNIGTFTGVDRGRSMIWSEVANAYIAGTKSGSADAILTSALGVTWIVRTDPSGASSHGNISESVSNGVIVMPTGSSANLITSTDGTSWTNRANPTGAALYSSAYSPDLDLFVVVGSAGVIATSPGSNVATWTNRTSPVAVDLFDVCWDSASGYFIAVGEAGTVLRSDDGVTWDDMSIAADVGEDLTSVFSDGGSAAYATAQAHFLRTLDGAGSWEMQPMPANLAAPIHGMYADGRIVLFGDSGGPVSTEPAVALSVRVTPIKTITP